MTEAARVISAAGSYGVAFGRSLVAGPFSTEGQAQAARDAFNSSRELRLAAGLGRASVSEAMAGALVCVCLLALIGGLAIAAWDVFTQYGIALAIIALIIKACSG